jgi:hypothetical protein
MIRDRTRTDSHPRSWVIIVLPVALFWWVAGAPAAAQQNPFNLVKTETVDGATLDDEARGISVDSSGNVFVAGYVTIPGHGRDIWIARYDQDLVLQDSVTVNGPASGDDEGYTMAFDGSGNVFVVGYMTEPGEGHNVWLGAFDADLDLIDSVTVNGSANDDDDGYGILYDPISGNLYLAGTLRETGEGSNIWLAIYDTDLDLVDAITMNGPNGDDTDKARFMTFDDTRHLFVSGSMSQNVTNYDIWIGKFEDDLDFVDQIVVAGPTTDEDKGYGIVFDGSDTIFVTGTMIEPGESYNIWMAKYDTDLNLIEDLTINGPGDGEDVAYLMIMDEFGRLYHTGVLTENAGGSNIWVARFDQDLNLDAWTTVDGPASAYDTGVGLAAGNRHDLYVSAVVSDPVRGLDIWVGRFDVSLIFGDGFESGDSDLWTMTTP